MFSRLKQDSQQAIAIIDKYINVDNILAELKDGTTIIDVEEVIRLHSSTSGLSVEQIARQMMIEKWKKYSSCQEVITAQEDVDSFSVLLKSYKRLVGDELDLQTLQQYNADMLHCLPLNILNLLHQENVVSLLHYLMVVNHENVLKEFIAHLNFIIHNHLSTHEDLVTDFLSTLILYGYSGERYSKGIRRVSGYIAFNIFKTILQHLIRMNVKEQAISFSSIVTKLSSNQEDFYKTCFKQVVGLWITNNPNINALEAIAQQSQWSVCHFNKQLCEVYKELASSIGFKAAVNCIDNVISRKEVNWKNLLSLVSSMYVSSEESRISLQDLIERNLSEGLKEQETENLFIAFLFARQVSLEGGHAFTNYAEWFKKHFGLYDGNQAAQSSRNFRFLIKFLTKILPHDIVKFLKVHVVKPPHAPNSCRKVLNEYLMSARIRLKELGANLEENENQDVKANKIKDEVQQSLNEYEKFGKIPRSIMEMSIFRKLYFNGKYLQELLKPRILPAKEDIKMKFIKDLYRMQKIPRPMHEKYAQECNQKNTKLVNEIIEIDMDSDFEEDPLQEVEKILYKIQMQIDNGLQQSGTFDILELTTDLKRQLSVIEGDKLTSDDVTIEIGEVDVSTAKAETCDMIFNFYGNWNIHDNPDIFKPLRIVMGSILNHQQILTALGNKVWKLCTECLSSISERGVLASANIISVIGDSVVVKSCVKNIHSVLFKHFEVKHTIHDDLKISAAMHYMLVTSLPFENLATNFQNISILISNLQSNDDRFFNVFCTFIQLRGKYIRDKAIDDKSQPALKRIHQEEIEPEDFLLFEMLVDENQDILLHFEQRMMFMEVLKDANFDNLKSLLEILLEHVDLSTARDNGAPQGCKQFVKVFCESFDVLIEACPDEDSYKILTQVLRNLLAKYKTDSENVVYNELKRKQISRNMFSFILSCSFDVIFLLPYKVFNAESLWDDGDLNSKSIIQDALMNTALLFHSLLQYSDMSFVFSHELTLHITSAIIQIGNKYQNAILLFITAFCPEIFASILYFSCKDAGLSLMLQTRLPKLFDLIKKVQNLLCTVQSSLKRDYEGNHAEHSGVLTLLAEEMSGAIFHDNIITIDEDVDELSELCLSHAIIAIADDIKMLPQGLLNNVLGFVISGIAIKSWQLEKDTESASSIKICNQCLEQISPDHFMTTCFTIPTSFKNVDENIKKIFPFLLLRLLCQANVPSKILSHHNFVRSLLKLKQNVDNLFANALVDEAIALEGKYTKLLKSAVKYLNENERRALLEIHKTDVQLCQILRMRK